MRERRAVEALRKKRPIRIGRVQVDQEKLDIAALDEFLKDINVYVSYKREDGKIVKEYCDTLARKGFRLFLDYDFSSLGTRFDWASMRGSEDFKNAIKAPMKSIAENGWLLVFLSPEFVHHGWSTPDSFLRIEFEMAALYGRKLVPIVLHNSVLSGPLGSTLAGMEYFDATKGAKSAPLRLAHDLLIR